MKFCRADEIIDSARNGEESRWVFMDSVRFSTDQVCLKNHIVFVFGIDSISDSTSKSTERVEQRRKVLLPLKVLIEILLQGNDDEQNVGKQKMPQNIN